MHANFSLESALQAHPDSVNWHLARRLDIQRNDIINDWLDRVQKDPANQTDPLAIEQVRDHLPQLFDDLTDTLNCYGWAADYDSFDQIYAD